MITTLAFRSAQRPLRAFKMAYVMKPSAMPLAMEKVSGIIRAVTTAGAASVTSSQSMSLRPLAIRTAT